MTSYTEKFIIIANTRHGLDFDLRTDFSANTPRELYDFFDQYASEYFGYWAGENYTLIPYLPDGVFVAFSDTSKGRELATLFKLGHDCR